MTQNNTHSRECACDLPPLRGSDKYKLVCSECGFVMELANIIQCPKCGVGIMVWTPEEWVKHDSETKNR